MKINLRLWQCFKALAIAFALSISVLVGCHSKQNKLADQNAAMEAVVKRSNELYREYLEGDRDQARRSLLETIQFIEGATLSEYGRACTLQVNYAYLYVLEKRSGNEDLAEAYLVKARYWFLRSRELNGSPVTEAYADVKKYTAEKCMEGVDKWDKSHTDGKGPKYVRQTQ